MSEKFEVVMKESADEIEVRDGDDESRIGNEFSRRIQWKKEDGTFLTLTSTVFLRGRIVDKEGNFIEDADHEDIGLPFFHGVFSMDNFEDDQRFLELWEEGEDEWIHHTVQDEVGDSELSSDTQPIEGIGYLWPTSLQDAYDKLRYYIGKEDYFNYYHPENA